MVIRVDWILGTQDAAKQLDSAIGNDLFATIERDIRGIWKYLADLVHIHVALSTTSGLEYNEREVVDKLARNDLGEKVSERGGGGVR